MSRTSGQQALSSADPNAAPTPSLDFKNKSSQEITTLILKGYDRWNAQDLDGYMEMFWKSPDLVYTVDNEVTWGWAELRAALLRAYPNRSAMGTINSERLQVRVLTSDLATAVNSWSMQFPKVKLVGTSLVTLRKFSEGWRVISDHTSSSEIPLN
jgi:ketosteroid isomerase-like protein